ncbi:WD40-repeat-containing domain protein [Suillus clintonianus]|uniref:WD40-repeat-containing domain protein n=1 Tax=Suillus clintonianus TaxID=1904413 RepID=UPI001B863660|nr:WD40-repeat-containing domain protein [Suillus clintonianus]KAG2133766.1 WD40-repeat-containing domain protein [Suillus clintonianus]
MPYKLSATLSAHSSDVRAVASPTDSIILSASRDSTAISWNRSSPTVPFTLSSVLRAGSRFVNAVEYISPSPEAPQGYAVVGGQDTVVNIFALGPAQKEDPEYSLVGHTDNVCALNVSQSGTIISGSWDKTAKVWKQFQLVYDLKGHQQAVWGVLAIDDDQFLTASADRTIKYWVQHKMMRTYEGHKDAVRGLTLIPDIGFASCSNDSEIRVWTMQGDVVYTLSGHTSFVYSLSVLPNGEIVSGGEDRSVRVWRDGECVQMIVHPAISVWAVSTMPNGDIVSGCSDGIVRVFSESEERWASAAELKALEDQIASQALSSQQVGDVKKTDLPGPDALLHPGKKPGEVKMIKNGDLVEAHQWDSATSNWQKIGDVVDAVGSGRKQLFNGKEYDYVFDVDVQEGAPPLKLPFNVSENPYAAAQRFLEQNDLSTNYIDEVVKFIEKNTSGVNLGVSNDYVDPYTGASRYQAAATSPAPAPSTAYMDPFTGAARYSGAPAPTPPVPSASPSAPKIIPFAKFVSFKQANVSAMQAKLYQFDEALRNEISTASLAMYPEELVIIEEAFAYLSQVTSTTSKSSLPPLGGIHADAIIQILERWPASQRFPMMDLSRLVAAYCADASASPGARERFFASLFKASDWTEVRSHGKAMSKAQETNILLLFRTVANCFQEGTPVDEGQWVAQVFEALSHTPYALLTKVQRVALATILFNFSCAYLTTSVARDVLNQHTGLVLQLLRSNTDDAEVTYRTLVALGNVVYAGNKRGTLLDSARSAELRTVMSALPTFPDDRIRNVVDEIKALL